ncbi:hypothetical protein ASPVEDRAFT_82002 [Aspergillus versicolor CBS 583.65]|uniref:Uncharacterized protein n=1 Tax=Aspergillus versicolor CBS 583.65 TaxID=1036611 RepID=A0A1L9PFY9_ASPVE|nr:uncharacterized protein ASPVEDRAFT_82002 [Aspergillus versicolor CBS 583.65]OJJ00430.1 hypothetical protein ASPVEDRAFT_82002 [Aspergillus versicolor CBS 583.65]
MAIDEKYEYDALPIPSYEEATTNRASSSRTHLPDQGSDDPEGQALLHDDRRTAARDGPQTRPHGYHPPTVESVRNSVDDLHSSPATSERGSLEELRGELDQMDVEDGGQHTSQRSRLRSRFSKPFSNLSRTLSSIHLPFRRYLPNFKFTIDLNAARTSLSSNGCIIMLRLFGLLLVVAIIYIFVVSDIFNLSSRFVVGQTYNAASVENFVQGHINESNIAENLRRVTEFPHIAGTEGSYVLAEWIQRAFEDAGLEAINMEEYQVYMNYPQKDGRRVAVVDPPDLKWEAILEEQDAETPVFHGHSKSGNVTGHLVYANYGSREDFQHLKDKGVNLNGSIALVRYYGTESDRALKVKAAELAGAVGCIIYSDPADDGFVRGAAYPNGRFMPSDGVQRGAVSQMSYVVGDLLSPGFASTPKMKTRLSLDQATGAPKIPSLPLAWRDAQRLLQVLEGHGSKVPKKWVGGVPEVKHWWTGDEKSPIVNLKNIQDEEDRQPIYNVIGRIYGMEEPEKKIIVGNHRDSWCLGSADPGSGTAVFLELVRVFGELLTLGWRPLRTIEFASWDAEEYNLIGSTEHVEESMDNLRGNAYAYINVDVGVSGTDFEAAGCPLYERVVMQVLGRISDPVTNETLKDIWEQKKKRFAPLGAGSDYVPFQDLAGISSIDFGFTGDPYPYHSCHENYDWMAKFGDPGFQYHKILGQFWGLLLLQFADNPILPYDVEVYAERLASYVIDLERHAKSKDVPIDNSASKDSSVNLTPLYNATSKLRGNAEQFQRWPKLWHDAVWGAGGFENNMIAVQRMSHNFRMAKLDVNLLDNRFGGGIPNRTQFKHVVFGPQLWSGYDAAIFPAIQDSLEAKNWTLTQEWVDRIAGIILDAGDKLLHD